jgi:hypothetical protein
MRHNNLTPHTAACVSHVCFALIWTLLLCQAEKKIEKEPKKKQNMIAIYTD